MPLQADCGMRIADREREPGDADRELDLPRECFRGHQRTEVRRQSLQKRGRDGARPSDEAMDETEVVPPLNEFSIRGHRPRLQKKS